MKLLSSYINGNYKVSIFNDGTKIRENELDNLIPDFPESMDVKITNQCNIMCEYCHEDSKPDGQHGDIMSAKFIDSLAPYTEMAIGGGNPLAHPDLIEFLEKLKSNNVIANITVNQKHFLENQPMLQNLVKQKMIYGIGVSLTKATDELLLCLNMFPNVVLHVINGIVSLKELEILYDQDFKILVLGYKRFRRGEQFYCEDIEVEKQDMYDNISEIAKHFKVVSFDNSAIKQLELKRILSKEKWNEFYMGDDGQFTMYIDLVNGKFARSSTSEQRFDLKYNIKEMFEVVRNLK